MSKIEKVRLLSGLPQADWNETNETKPSYLKNKPAALPADGGNSNTVNGHTVDADVPADAKFTDTNAIIDVEEFPAEDINENALYRKVELEAQKYLIQGEMKVADGETADGLTLRIIDVEVLPEVGIIFQDESTVTLTFYVQTSTMTAHLYAGAETGWIEPSLIWGDSWGGVITSEEQAINSELIYILYTIGLGDIVYSMCNGQKNDMNGTPVTCIVVDTLPEIGEACTDASSSFIKLYYQKQDGIAYGYLTAELSGSAAMWMTINELSVALLGADYFGGYIADDAEATDSTKLYIVHKVIYPTYKLYYYKNKWTEVNEKINVRGTETSGIAIGTILVGEDSTTLFAPVDSVLAQEMIDSMF